MKERHLIIGDYNEKWKWQSYSNSLNYLIRLLWKNTLPREWYVKFHRETENPEKLWDSEEGIMYYFYNDKTKKTDIRLQRAQGDVDKEYEIISVVQALLDHENDPYGMKFL